MKSLQHGPYFPICKTGTVMHGHRETCEDYLIKCNFSSWLRRDDLAAFAPYLSCP